MFKVVTETLEKCVKYVQSICFYCLLWTYFTPFSSISVVDFEQVNISWDSNKTSFCSMLFSIWNDKEVLQLIAHTTPYSLKYRKALNRKNALSEAILHSGYISVLQFTGVDTKTKVFPLRFDVNDVFQNLLSNPLHCCWEVANAVANYFSFTYIYAALIQYRICGKGESFTAASRCRRSSRIIICDFINHVCPCSTMNFVWTSFLPIPKWSCSRVVFIAIETLGPVLNSKVLK